MNLVGFDTERPEDERMAGEILQTLSKFYPGHDWFVLIRGGIVQIKISDWSDKWGMSIHYTDLSDAGVRRDKVKRAAGEFLERANMIRGRKTDDRLEAIEGVPERHLLRAKLLQ